MPKRPNEHAHTPSPGIETALPRLTGPTGSSASNEIRWGEPESRSRPPDPVIHRFVSGPAGSDSPPGASQLRLRVLEEPLTAHNMATVLSGLTDLYVKLVLLTNGRWAGLVDFNQTHDPSYYKDFPLAVTSLTRDAWPNMGHGTASAPTI